MGSIEHEIIPFSIAGFYSKTRVKKKEKSVKTSIFSAARKDFMMGNFENAEKNMSKLMTNIPLGMFSYLVDLTMFFSPTKIHRKSILYRKQEDQFYSECVQSRLKAISNR